MDRKTEGRYIDLSKIVIPAKDARNWYPDKPDIVINVTPQSDRWLADNSRTYDEVNQSLEGRLNGIETNLLEDKPNAYRITYGLETEITLPQARFLAYVDLLAKNQTEQSIHENCIAGLKIKYSEEVAEIDDRAKSKNLAMRDKTKLYKNTYKSEIDKNGLELRDDRKIHELILRKAVIEIFAPQENGGLTSKRLPGIIDEIKENLSDTPDDKKEKVEARIDGLLDKLTKYLPETRDRILFSKYNYRESADLVTSANDTKNLTTALQFALNPESLSSSEKTQKQMSKLGQSYLMFLGNRAFKPVTEPGDKYPRLSLIYDTYASAFFSKNTTVLSNVGNKVIDVLYPNYGGNRDVINEASKLVGNFATDFKSLPEIDLVKLENDFENPPESIINFGMKPEYRMVFGLTDLYARYPDFVESGVLNISPNFNKVENALGSALGKKDPYFSIDFENSDMKFLDKKMSYLDVTTFLKKKALADLYTTVVFHSFGLTESTYTLEEKPRFVKDKWKAISNTMKELYKEDYFEEMLPETEFLYLLQFWQEDRSRIKTVERQNEKLKHEINDNAQWFVSPRGDIFSANQDQEIAEKGIASLTFGIDRAYPREHKVKVVWSGEVKPTNYWIDSEGRLLNGDREPLMLESVFYQLYSNIMLRHLFVITSGILSDKTEKEIIDAGMGEKRIEWKRAHYRTYKEGSRFTMESGCAHEHARQIKDDYGIDIYKEIKRRREIGTLLPNQVMTFVRESQPHSEGYDAKPKELPFDPSWIPTLIP